MRLAIAAGTTLVVAPGEPRLGAVIGFNIGAILGFVDHGCATQARFDERTECLAFLQFLSLLASPFVDARDQRSRRHEMDALSFGAWFETGRHSFSITPLDHPAQDVYLRNTLSRDQALTPPSRGNRACVKKRSPKKKENNMAVPSLGSTAADRQYEKQRAKYCLAVLETVDGRRLELRVNDGSMSIIFEAPVGDEWHLPEIVVSRDVRVFHERMQVAFQRELRGLVEECSRGVPIEELPSRYDYFGRVLVAAHLKRWSTYSTLFGLGWEPLPDTHHDRVKAGIEAEIARLTDPTCIGPKAARRHARALARAALDIDTE